MRGLLPMHWVARGVLALLLALAGITALAHAAEHLDSDSNCPMCVQGHASGPILSRVPLAPLPPAPAERAPEALIPPLENGRHTTPCAGRAPPTVLV